MGVDFLVLVAIGKIIAFPGILWKGT